MDQEPQKTILYADDDTEPVPLLLRLRLPPLFLGLLLGIGVSFLTSRFENVLQQNIHVAFFIPFVVYIADAIGTQTQTIFARDLKTGRAKLHTYLVKESLIGLTFGLLFGFISSIVVLLWLADLPLAVSIGISVCLAMFTAPIIAIVVSEIIQKFHEDPAVGSGPIATVIQDAVSIVLYGIITSVILA
jgi:magnesium transporter